MHRLVPAFCVLALLAPRAARADKDIVIEVPGERTMDNKLFLGGLAGAGFLVGAVGAYFHLDSRSAANDVSSDRYTGHAWTSEDEALVDSMVKSGHPSTPGYSDPRYPITGRPKYVS